MNKDYYCVIMAGGVGSRFWPMSKKAHPKQFLDILGTGETLLQQTFNRFAKICPKENIYIVTNEIYRNLVKDQLTGIDDEQILGEPSLRNTAPCISYANYKILDKNPEAKIVVAPSDHIILKEDVFVEVINYALDAVSENDCLLTLGITPSRPDTGYGYIQFNETETYDKDKRIRKVKTFTEKPNLEIAKSFLESGDFLWNSGIFIWSLKNILNAFDNYLPEVNNIFKEGISRYNTSNEIQFIEKAYSVCKNISIDYGIMEKANNVYVLASEFGWSDLGTWGSLYSLMDKDKNENAVIGKNIMLYDSKSNIINMPDNKLAIIQGLDDYIVVENENILLICKKADEQNIRQIVNDVKSEKGEKYI